MVNNSGHVTPIWYPEVFVLLSRGGGGRPNATSTKQTSVNARFAWYVFNPVANCVC